MIKQMFKDYRLKIKIKEIGMDYGDTCTAENRMEASRAFWMQLPENMKEHWPPGILETYILTKEQKAEEDSLDILINK